MEKTANNNPLRLVLASDFGKPMVWDFTGPMAIVIGRGEDSAIKLADISANEGVSRHHAVIELGRNKARIRDLKSLNGTYLNGHLVGKREEDNIKAECGIPICGSGSHLQDGDLLTLANFNFKVSLFSEINESNTLFSIINNKCPGCGKSHQTKPISQYPDVLCATCENNPLASLKLLRAGLSRRIKSLESLKGLKIIKTLGRGSTSAVFLTVRKDNSFKMALKIMPPAISGNDWARKSFLREVAIGRAVKHKNVAKLYDFGFYSGAYFYLMEYCSGGNSEDYRIRQGGTLKAVEALKIILPTLDGLNYLHNIKLAATSAANMQAFQTEGLVHRDLKPANIFLGGVNGHVPKVADIGVGKLFGTTESKGHTRTGSVAGSPATMPRQQVLNFKYAEPEVDIWAAAASLYRLLTGQYPRTFPKNEDPWRIVLSSKPKPILDVKADIPKYLAAAIDEALIDDPKIIHQTALSFKKALIEAAKKDGLFGDLKDI